MCKTERIEDRGILAQLRRDTLWMVTKYGYDRVVEWLTPPQRGSAKKSTRLNKGRLWFYAHGKWGQVAPTVDDAITIKAIRTLKEQEAKMTEQERKDLQSAIRLSQQALAKLSAVEQSLAKRGKKK